MQIVIDIPDEIYETLKNNGVIVNGLRCGKTFLSEVFAAIANGTPLDEIRSEIRHFMYDINPNSSESDYACDYILQIIDKYKAESEEL